MKDRLYRWNKGSILKGSIFEGYPGRSLAQYAKSLGFSIDEVKGKHILDLGAGSNARLESELGKDTFVVSLSPDYSFKKHRKVLLSKIKHALAALGQRLPFVDGCFDEVFLYHVVEHVSLDDLCRIVEESLRVLKSPGTVRVMPLLPDHEALLRESIRQPNITIDFQDTAEKARFHDDSFEIRSLRTHSSIYRSILHKNS